MIKLYRVAQFMQQHIVDEVLRKQLQVDAETNVPPVVAAAPTAVAVAKGYASVSESMLVGKFFQSGRKFSLGNVAQGCYAYADEPLLHRWSFELCVGRVEQCGVSAVVSYVELFSVDGTSIF